MTLHAFYEDYESRRRRKHPHTPPIANPLKGLRLTEHNERIRFLTDDEETRLRAALANPVDWTIVLTAMHSGAREGNVFRLRWPTDVNFTSRMLRTWSRKGRKKVLRERWVPINDELHRALVALPSRGRSEFLFPNASNTASLDPKNWYHRVWKPALREAKIENLRFHDLRHTTASRLRHRGVPIEDIAEVLGHADTRVTQRYAHIAPGRLRDVMQLLARDPDAAHGDPPGDTRPETALAAVAAVGEKRKAARRDSSNGRCRDRTCDPRLVRPMLCR